MSKTRKLRRARSALLQAKHIVEQSRIVRDLAVAKSDARAVLLKDIRAKWDKVCTLLVDELPRGNVLRNLAEGTPEIILDWTDVDRLRDLAAHGYRVPVPSLDLTAMDVETIYPLVLKYAMEHGKRDLEYTMKLSYGDQRVYHALTPDLVKRLPVDYLVKYISGDMARYLQDVLKGDGHEY